MENILVVDDDQDLVEMVSILLARKGMRVHSIDTGDDFFDTVASFHPQVILMDIYLGKHDGRNLCHTLKTTGNFRNIPVILYSAGNITSLSIQESLADAFITKPFSLDKIVEKIRSYM